MPAGKHGASEITVNFDATPGGVLTDVTQHILTMGGAKIENMMQPSHAFGDAWAEMLATGFAKVPAITFTGFYDDTATTGPHTVFQVKAADRDPQGATRTLTLGFGNSVTFSGETRLESYEVIGMTGAIRDFAAFVLPTGAFTWSA